MGDFRSLPVFIRIIVVLDEKSKDKAITDEVKNGYHTLYYIIINGIVMNDHILFY